MPLEDAYKNTALKYDTYVEPFNKVLRKIALKLTKEIETGKLLEIGCGTGSNLKLFSERGWRIFGIDLSPAMLGQARKKLNKKTGLAVADAFFLPFPSDSFDLALAMLTLHEMPPGARATVIEEMRRVVRPGGYILLIDFHPGPFDFIKGWYYRAVIFFFERMAGGEHYKNFRDFMRRKGLPELIKSTGLQIVLERIVGGGNIGFHLIRVVK